MYSYIHCYKDGNRSFQIVTYCCRLLNIGTDWDILLQIVTKRRLYGMSCILVSFHLIQINFLSVFYVVFILPYLFEFILFQSILHLLSSFFGELQDLLKQEM